MEFSFNINDVLEDEISSIDCKLNIGSSLQTESLSKRNPQLKTQLTEIINKMGYASGLAQNLKTPITSTNKLLQSDHTLYILKDCDANLGKGAIVGIVKIGKKKLFLLDPTGAQFESSPVCLLDFYVHESRQREGYGRKLYNHMLKKENIGPHQLAIDRPSSKCINFLHKHYKLTRHIPQVNNFIIFDKFFHNQDIKALVDYKKPPLFPYLKKGVHRKSSLTTDDVLPFINPSVKKQEQLKSQILYQQSDQQLESAVKNMNFSVVSRPGSKRSSNLIRSHFTEVNNISDSSHSYGLQKTHYSRHASNTAERIFPWQAEHPVEVKAGTSSNNKSFTPRRFSTSDAILDESSSSPTDEKDDRLWWSYNVGDFIHIPRLQIQEISFNNSESDQETKPVLNELSSGSKVEPFQGNGQNLSSKAKVNDEEQTSAFNRNEILALENKEPEPKELELHLKKTHHYHHPLW